MPTRMPAASAARNMHEIGCEEQRDPLHQLHAVDARRQHAVRRHDPQEQQRLPGRRITLHLCAAFAEDEPLSGCLQQVVPEQHEEHRDHHQQGARRLRRGARPQSARAAARSGLCQGSGQPRASRQPGRRSSRVSGSGWCGAHREDAANRRASTRRTVRRKCVRDRLPPRRVIGAVGRDVDLHEAVRDSLHLAWRRHRGARALRLANRRGCSGRVVEPRPDRPICGRRFGEHRQSPRRFRTSALRLRRGAD